MESREEILANFQACTGIEVSIVLEGEGGAGTLNMKAAAYAPINVFGF